MRKVWTLLGTAVLAAVLKAFVHFREIPHLAFPGTLAAGARRASTLNFTFALDPSLLLVAVGALGSLRSGVSMFAGSCAAWLVLGPIAVTNGWAQAGVDDPTKPWFPQVVQWLLWPGVAMMVTASLTSVAFSWRAIVRTFTGGRVTHDREQSETERIAEEDTVSFRSYAVFGVLVLLALVVVQVVFFGIAWWAGVLAVLLSFVLAAVAGRVSGETSITPIGAMGKVTQLVFGVAVPASPTANLMSANVTAGAASLCADLLHDMKTGTILGASPRAQAISQGAGVFCGALAVSGAYLVLLPNPREQIGSDELPGPAVQTWRAVAEVFRGGFDAMPAYAIEAMVIGAVLGIALTVIEKVLPEKARNFVPSPAAFGLGFVVQGWSGISLFLGALLGFVLRRRAADWSERYLIPIAAGIIAGESLMGVAIALRSLITG
jgi:OPT family oligopeptide transporter